MPIFGLDLDTCISTNFKILRFRNSVLRLHLKLLGLLKREATKFAQFL